MLQNATVGICLSCEEACILFQINQEWCLECLISAKNILTRKEVA